MGKDESRQAYKDAAGPGRENVDKEADKFAERVEQMEREDRK